MILSFKKNFPDKSPTGFVQKILSGQKIHSMRNGERWKAGHYIHMATGTRTANYNQFNIDRPDLQKCISTQKVFMTCSYFSDITNENDLAISIDDRLLLPDEIDCLIKNDGLTLQRFIYWFFPDGNDIWIGQIIHWTNFKY